MVSPDLEATAFYEGRYPFFRELYRQTRDIAHRLAAGPGGE